MSELHGRWDLIVGSGSAAFPSWVELGVDGGRFVGRFGSARPVGSIELQPGMVRFTLPKQYEGRDTDMVFEGRLEGDALVGQTVLDDGSEAEWVGHRAPELSKPGEVDWGPVSSLIGTDLVGWRLRSPEWKSFWSNQDETLYNSAAGSDIVSDRKFKDFKLIAEYKYPEGSNSGIYLRGRYEVQILDDHGHAPGLGTSAAIYGFIAPSRNAIHPFDEWNRAEITLVGRFVTIVLNGVTVIDDQEIPGITGGALDSAEGEPGPIFLQGDHGPVVFRRLDVFERV